MEMQFASIKMNCGYISVIEGLNSTASFIGLRKKPVRCIPIS
jgi:hypothetical protein